MSLALRPGLSWCRCAGQAVFLDLPRDRYFCLPQGLDETFRRWTAGEALGADEIDALCASGIAERGADRLPAITSHPVAARDLANDGAHSRNLPDVLRAIREQLRARRQLKRGSLATLFAATGARRPSGTGDKEQGARYRRIARAFATSAMFLRAADQCLPRAIAARHLCDRHGLPAALVFGVRLHPFSAHSWVQAGDAVIVGDLEQVRLYTPILVIP